MGPAIRLLAALVRDVRFLVLTGVGVFGCSAFPCGDPAPTPDAASPLTRVCYYPDETPADGSPPSLNMPAVVPPIASRPLQILALSGGVAGVPFTAGALVGWTRTGTRPLFDQVTGISSGSLVGAYAFLGPKYDAQMQRLILSLSTADLIKFRPLYCMLHDGAFGSAKPAEKLIQRAFDDGFIDDLRCAYAEGRRLFIGTMNLETKRLAVWDIGAIASSGRPDANDMVRKVLLAAVSWPGAVPPVAFDIEVNGRCYREEHCDAGSVAMTLSPIGPLPSCPSGSDLYVLASRKLYSDPEPVPKRAFHRIKPSVTAIFEALTRANISELYYLCWHHGLRFHLLAEPQDYHGEAPSITHLYPKEAPRLFELGYRIGSSGPCWRCTPPGAEASEAAIPRDGQEIRPNH
ncbi:MAG TPA: patatin-like phospholipase family protein [Gemmataceae bacterium]|nr:patatin-like phospholipase family protein [Gemmataceae bacterium]